MPKNGYIKKNLILNGIEFIKLLFNNFYMNQPIKFWWGIFFWWAKEDYGRFQIQI